jgi:hypothetical protein
MGSFKGWLRSAMGVLRIGGVGIGAIAVIVGLVVDVAGGSTLWSLTPDRWFTIGLALIAVFGAASIIRHEYLMHAFGEMWGNEHSRKLLQDGIAPYRDVYFRYVRSGDYATAYRFWQAGFVNISDEYGNADLNMACESGHSAIARGIIERGGDPKRPDGMGRTPMMHAASRGHLKVAEVLLEHDCALDATSTGDGVSALYAAASNGHGAIVDLLIKFGAKIDSIDRDNITPLMAAIARQKWDISQSLIAAGADLKRIDASGATLLDYALSREAPDDVKQKILDAGIGRAQPLLISRGSGHHGTGKVDVGWELESEVLAQRKLVAIGGAESQTVY